MTADPTAAPDELAHYGGIAQYLSEPRRQILETVDRCGPTDLAELTDCWRRTYLEPTAGVEIRPGRRVTGLLWKLEALGWIAERDGWYESTASGRRALAAGAPAPGL